MEEIYKKIISMSFLKKLISVAILAVLFLGISSICLQAQPDDLKKEKGENLYFQAKEMFVYPVPKFDEIIIILGKSIPYFRKIENKQSSNYWLAEVAYLKGIVEKERNNHEMAENNFSFCKKLINDSLDIGDSSEGYRLLADVEGQLISYHNLYYKTKFGPRIKNFIEKAIELDYSNQKSYISLAMYYRDAPLIAGGSFKKSEAVLKKMIDVTHSDRIDLFSLYLWINTAWINSNYNQEKVKESIALLNLFSNQADIDYMAKRIKKNM